MDFTSLFQQQIFPPAIIPRPRYYHRLESLLTTQQIIVVQGQRRVGKSFVVLGYLQTLHLKPHQIFYFNTETDNKNLIKSNRELVDLYEQFVQRYGEPEYIFIDEIQNIHEWERFIRAKFVERKQKLIISGSNAQLLSTELTTYLTGRYIPLEIFPLDYCEFLDFTHQEHAPTSFDWFMRRGGMPELTFIPETMNREAYLQSVLSTILLKDIISRFTVKEPVYLEKILNYLADTIGSQISLRNIKKSSQHYGREVASLTTLSTYISYLELPYLLHKVGRFDIHGKKILEYNEKYYFNDLGMRNSLRVHMEMDIGKLLENMVYLHLRKLWYKVYVGMIGNKEIDFMARRGEDVVYIQVAYLIPDTATRAREFDNLLEINDAYPKIVVSADPLAHGSHKGIKRIHIYDFIREFR